MKKMKQLDHIEVSEEKKQQIFEQVLTKKSMKYFKPSLIITLVSVLILAVLVSFPSFRNAPIIQNNLIISAVAMESDASIILNLNDNDQVVSIETTGEEVKFIQNKTDLVGLNVQDAMAIILELEDYQKILNNENLEIIIYSDSDSKELNLGTQVNEVLTKHMRNESCNMQYVDKETFDKARQRNMGVGKYTRIENILKSDDTYTFDELEKCSMNELTEIQGKFKWNGHMKGCK